MHKEHKELRSEVGNKVEQAKTGKHELKSQIYIKCGHVGRYGFGTGWHKCAEKRISSAMWCRTSLESCRTTQEWCRTTRVWCRTTQLPSELEPENAQWSRTAWMLCQTVQLSRNSRRKNTYWCRTARPMRLRDYFSYLTFYLFLR